MWYRRFLAQLATPVMACFPELSGETHGEPMNTAMTRYIRTLIPLLALVVLSTACNSAARDESGQIVEAGSEDVFALKVGDCFDDPENFGEVSSVAAVPCSDPHDNEIYYTFDLPGSIFPGEESIDATALDECLTAFDPYVGVAYEESRLDVSYLAPTAESWDAGDREIACMLYNLDFTKIAGSMQGAGV